MLYRTDGSWGSGKGTNLTPVEVDENFFELRSDLDYVIANPPAANGIADIEVAGATMTVTLTGGQDLGPFPLPVLQFRWRGTWAPATLYAELDALKVDDEGIFTVLYPHTSAGSFDPAAVGGTVAAGSFDLWRTYVIQTVGTTDFTLIGAASNTVGVEFIATGIGTGTGTAAPKLYHQLIGIGTNAALGDLVDVTLTSSADGQILSYDAGSGQWVNIDPPAGNLAGLTDVNLTSPADGDFLGFDGAEWINQASVATSGLGDATLPVDPASFIEISEPTGGTPAYDSKKIEVGDLLDGLAPLASPALTGTPTAPTAAPGTNSTQLATTAYADAAAAAIIAAADAMVFKGVIDCSSNPNYPAADRGHTYRVSVAGKIGGASGPNVEAGDILLCLTDGTAAGTHAAVGANWSIIQANLDGAVIGPASAVDSRIAAFDGTTGKLLKDGGILTSAILVSGGALGTPSSGTLTNASGLPLTTGVTGVLPGANGGTGVNNSGKTITLGGNLTTSGAFAATLTLTGTTDATLPAGTHTLAGLDVAQTWAANQQFNSGNFLLKGSSSGTLTVKPAAAAGSNTLTLPAGTTDFSATGGASQVVKQTSAGGAFTVAQLAASDLSNGTTGTGSVVLAAGPTLSGTIAGTYTIGGTPTLGVAMALPGGGQISSGGALGLGGTPTFNVDVQANNAVIGARGTTTSGTPSLAAAAHDYFTSFAAATLVYYGSATAGTIAGVNKANAGQINFQNLGGAVIGASNTARIVLYNSPAGTPTQRAAIEANGDLVQGTGSALATSATGGFFLISTCAGAPSGVPTNATAGQIPLIFDKTNFQLYAYISGTGWKKSAVWT